MCWYDTSPVDVAHLLEKQAPTLPCDQAKAEQHTRNCFRGALLLSLQAFLNAGRCSDIFYERMTGHSVFADDETGGARAIRGRMQQDVDSEDEAALDDLLNEAQRQSGSRCMQHAIFLRGTNAPCGGQSCKAFL